MAKYNIMRACGHVEIVQIFGTNAHCERDRREVYEGTLLCRTCLQAKRLKYEETKCLPVLTGSEKQIAWAITIRSKLLESAKKTRTRIEGMAQASDRDATLHLIDETVKILLEQTVASWWINNQDKTIQEHSANLLRVNPTLHEGR
jgi:hypothetical protein